MHGMSCPHAVRAGNDLLLQREVPSRLDKKDVRHEREVEACFIIVSFVCGLVRLVFPRQPSEEKEQRETEPTLAVAPVLGDQHDEAVHWHRQLCPE